MVLLSRRDFHVERSAPVLQVELLLDVLPLHGSHRQIVKGSIVVNSIRVHDQAVVGNDLDVLRLRLLQHIGKGIGVHRPDDDDLAAFLYHLLNLGNLQIDLIVPILKIHAVALLQELFLDIGPILVPALPGLRRHGNTDLRFLLVTAAAARHKDKQQYGHKNGKDTSEFHHIRPPHIVK